MQAHRIPLLSLLTAMAAAQQPAWPSTALYGRVVDAMHEGVPAAEVSVRDESGAVVARTIADGDGYYQLRRLPAGALRVHASADGKADGQLAVASDGLVREATLRLEAGARLAGVVSWPDGSACAGADVLVVAADPLPEPFACCFETTTDDSGRFVLAAVPQRTLRVLVFAPGHAMAVHVVGRGVGRDDAVRIPMPAAELPTRRVEVHGLPAGCRAVVQCEPVARGADPATWLPRRARVSAVGADGIAVLWALDERHEVRVVADGFRSMPVYVPCKPASTNALRFTMSPLPRDLVGASTAVRGRLVDELGKGIAGVVVGAVGDGLRAAPVATGPDGTFSLAVPVRSGVLCQFTVLTPAWHLAHPQSRLGEQGLSWMPYQADPERPIVLHAMRAGRVRGVLLGPTGVPFAAARVELHPVRVGEAEARAAHPVAVVAATDSAGGLDVAGLPPGRYELHASQLAGPSGSVTVDVPAGGEVAPTALEFAPGAAVEGVVADADGRPAAGVALRLMLDPRRLPNGLRVRMMARQPGIDVVTGSDGRFRLPRLAEGVYSVFALGPSPAGANVLELKQFEVVDRRSAGLELRLPR